MIPGWSPQVGVLPPFKKLEGSLPEINNLSQIQNTNEDPSNPSPPSLKKQPFFSSNVAVTSLGNKYKIIYIVKL